MAFSFLGIYRHDDFQAFQITPSYGLRGTHIFVANEEIAFDWRGFRPAPVLIEEYFASFKSKFLGWNANVEVLDSQLTCESFCNLYNRRKPKQFYQDPVPRALNFIEHHVLKVKQFKDLWQRGIND